MATKTEKLNSKIAELEAKRASLSADLEALQVSEDDLTAALGSAILANDKDVSKIEAELTAAGIRRRGLEAAAHKAAVTLQGLRVDLVKAAREEFHQHTLETAERIRLEMVAAYDQIKDLAAKEKAWQAELKNLVDIGGVQGYQQEASMAANLRNVWVFGGLQQYDKMEIRRGFTNNCPAEVLQDPALTWELRT